MTSIALIILLIWLFVLSNMLNMIIITLSSTKMTDRNAPGSLKSHYFSSPGVGRLFTFP